jgi:hypothetical protein
MSAADALCPAELELAARPPHNGRALDIGIDAAGWLNVWRDGVLLATFSPSEALELAGYFGGLEESGDQLV